ncbi:lysoplasmalogenase family protein [Clostridium thailandense]|uniref:lysoplasmalogenase family protein n=1 Tax=Clostridium thailandense TaxID=2794346 RepID=UPI00398A0C91
MGSINKSSIIKIILCLEIVIYIVFNYLDFNYWGRSNYSNIIKYIGILLCLLLAFLIGEDGYSREDTYLLQLALTLTAAADLCLLILDKFILGVFIFCIVQITYIIRHSGGKIKKKDIYNLIISILITIFVTTMFIRFIDYKLLLIGSIYAILLLYSVYTAWKTFSRNVYPITNCYLVSIAMTLFLLCDINVGASNIIRQLGISHDNIGMISNFLVWIFYLPSQVLLAISGYKKIKIFNI